MGKQEQLKITFHGAAGEVTGSCYLVEAQGVRFLVDCGSVPLAAFYTICDTALGIAETRY